MVQGAAGVDVQLPLGRDLEKADLPFKLPVGGLPAPAPGVQGQDSPLPRVQVPGGGEIEAGEEHVNHMAIP